MSIYDSMFSADSLLNEQIARQIFEILPEDGPLLMIVDRQGNCWPSDSEKFSRLNITESFLRELSDKIDDGSEPLVTQMDDCSIIASQLTTERTNCGYAIIALPQYSPESTLINIDLIEILLGQISLIAALIEKNRLLYELQIKHFGNYSRSEIALN